MTRKSILLLAFSIVWALCLVNIGAAQSGVIGAGTTINVRTNESIDTSDSGGRVFTGSVAENVLDRNNRIVIPRGSDVELMVRRVSNNEVALDLDSIMINGQRYGVQTEGTAVGSDRREGVGTNKRTGEFVGGGALLGAIIGGITGGGKGAAIGAAAGAGAGAGVQILTRGSRVEVPAESLLTFRLSEPLRAGAPDNGFNRDGQHYHSNGAVTPDSIAYRAGLRDGRSDADRGLDSNVPNRRWNNFQDRRDYQSGYNDGYQERANRDIVREKPGYYRDYVTPTVTIGRDKNVSWTGPDDAKLYVRVDNRPWQLFAAGRSGTQMASWITAGHQYLFVLRDAGGNEIARDTQDTRYRRRY